MSTAFDRISRELDLLIGEWEGKLSALPEAVLSVRRNNQQRSIRQIVGHMVDSATNNTHRIVHMHYQESPISFPDYANLGNNDRWISIQNYQQEDWDLLVKLWSSVNRHVAHVIKQADQKMLGQVWISALGEEVSLEEMIMDFPMHFKLHLQEIDELIQSK